MNLRKFSRNQHLLKSSTWIRLSPRSSVTRSVKLRYDSNASDASELDDVCDVLLRINMLRTERALLRQLRIGVRFEGKRLVVGHVPVEYVELVIQHGVQVLLDHGNRHIMTSCVDQDAAVVEARLVLYCCLFYHELSMRAD